MRNEFLSNAVTVSFSKKISILDLEAQFKLDPMGDPKMTGTTQTQLARPVSFPVSPSSSVEEKSRLSSAASGAQHGKSTLKKVDIPLQPMVRKFDCVSRDHKKFHIFSSAKLTYFNLRI